LAWGNYRAIREAILVSELDSAAEPGLAGWFRWQPDPGSHEREIPSLQLMALMFAGFQHAAPPVDSGIDREDACLQALELFNAGDGV
jgi:hypothetical protein